MDQQQQNKNAKKMARQQQQQAGAAANTQYETAGELGQTQDSANAATVQQAKQQTAQRQQKANRHS